MKGHKPKSLVSKGYIMNHNHFFAERARALEKVHQVWDTMLEDLRKAEVERIERETQPAIPVGARVKSRANRERLGTVVSTSVMLFMGSDDYYHPSDWEHVDEDDVFGDCRSYARGYWIYEVQMDPTENQKKRGRKGWRGFIDIDSLEVVEEEGGN